MRVSAKSDYALRALIEITQRWVANDPAVVSAEELSRAQGIPHGFLQGILADLRRAGVLASQRGQSGGWKLAVDPNEISVADVMRAVDGPIVSISGVRRLASPSPRQLTSSSTGSRLMPFDHEPARQRQGRCRGYHNGSCSLAARRRRW